MDFVELLFCLYIFEYRLRLLLCRILIFRHHNIKKYDVSRCMTDVRVFQCNRAKTWL